MRSTPLNAQPFPWPSMVFRSLRSTARFSMRILVVLFILINAWLFALGQGFFGLPPSEQGRTLQPAPLKDNPKIQIQNIRQ